MASDTTPLHICLLGDLRISRGDEPVPAISSVRAQSLLAYLVLHAGVPQSRRHLAFLLWPDSSDEQSRSNLRKLLHDLRRALPDVDRYLDMQGPTILWRADAPFTLDVADLERALNEATTAVQLQKAVALYQGPLFQSCYDDWVIPERERLEQLYLDALGRLVELLESAGEYRSAIQYGQLLLSHDALHEDVYRSLMRLYALTDDRAAALRTYQTCAAVLKKELGVEPSPVTKQAYERLLTLKESGGGVASPQTPLVGHSREWRELQGVWRQVATGNRPGGIGNHAAGKGQPHWVLLTGAAGIGKTRLAEELVSWAGKQGIPTASARCYATESGLGYGAIATWLRARPLPNLEPVWLGEVARLLPELLAKHPELPAPGPLTEAWQRLRFFEALARAVLASQPLILFLDDVQYCDRDTLEWLHYLLRYNKHASLMVVGTVCLEEVPAEGLPGLWTSLRRSGQLTEIAVTALSEGEMGELAGQVEGRSLAPEQVEELYTETEGNPLFVLELVRAGWLKAGGKGQPLPRTMEAVIAGRLGQLSAETQALVKVAAVIGREFTVEILGKASGVSEESLGRGLSELRQKRIVRMPRGGAYDFDHSQLRQVVYGGLNQAERQRLHRRVGEALVEQEGGTGNGQSGEIVAHFEKAGLWERAVPYQVRAGDLARKRYANETALAYYQRALPHLHDLDRLQVSLRLAHVLDRTGNWSSAESIYRQALQLASHLQDAKGRAECEMALGELMHRKGLEDDALVWLECARAGLESLGDVRSLGRVLQSLGIIYDLRGDDAHALAFHETRLGIAIQQQDPWGTAQGLGNIGMVYWRQGNYARALEFYNRQLELATHLEDKQEIARALEHQGMVYAEQANYAQAQRAYEMAFEISKEIGDRLLEGYLVGHIGRLYRAQGEFSAARAEFQKQLELMSELGARRGMSYALGDLGNLYREVGKSKDAVACYVKSAQLAMEMQDASLASRAVGDLALALREQGETRLALRLQSQASELLRALNRRYELAKSLYHGARLNFELNCYSDAEQLARQAAQVAGEIGHPRIGFDAQVLSLQARAMLGKQERAAAIRELEQMLRERTGEEHRATLYHALWRLDTRRVTWQQRAARMYRRLHDHMPEKIYRERYADLTGKSLKVSIELPAAPDMATRDRASLDELVKEWSRFSAQRRVLEE